MPPPPSAGLLLYRRPPAAAAPVELLLGHMGGPFWARKDEGAWSIPKGEFEPGEDTVTAARREFAEELGSPAPQVRLAELGTLRQSTGKLVTVWTGEADFDAASAHSNDVEMEWPPRSGRLQSFPEIDRAQWFDPDTARAKLVTGQRGFVDLLLELLGTPGTVGAPSGDTGSR